MIGKFFLKLAKEMRQIPIFLAMKTNLLGVQRASEGLISEMYRVYELQFDPKRDLFKDIGIETHRRCNNRCHFCPQGQKTINQSIDRKGEMSLELYKKIVEELGSLNYEGTITPHVCDEPFLDERIIKLISLARKNCPKAHIKLETNGTVLTERLVDKAFKAGLDRLGINDYTRNNQIADKVGAWETIQKYRNKIGIVTGKSELKRVKKLYHNWAGNIEKGPRIGYSLPLKRSCIEPFTFIYVGINGEVLPCCNDWKYEHVMGNLKEECIMEVWQNEKYKEIRSKLLRRDRTGLICEKCDALW